MEEIWKPIKGYESLYEVSNLGRVKSLKWGKERILRTDKSNNGYLRVVLCKDGKKKKYLVHRLVCESFLPNSNNLPEVNHKDENKTNNKVDNLEWCDRTYNNRYSQSVAVNQYTLKLGVV